MKNKIKILYIFLIILVSINIVLSFRNYNKTIEEMKSSFILNGDKEVTLEYGEDYIEKGYNAGDYSKYVKTTNNIDEETVGKYEVTYTLKYKRFKIKTKREVNIVDTESPTIELTNCSDEAFYYIGEKVKECTYKVSDNYDKDIENRVTVTSNVDTSKKGDYTVKYLVRDSNGNENEKIVKVHVRKKSDLNYIVITISKQKLVYYEKNKAVLETAVTTGRNNATKTGTFKIRSKTKDTVLKGRDYEAHVKYWMSYNGSFGIHDASWRSNFGNKNYNVNGSHGCVNVPTSAMKKLYNMVEIGTPVYIKK